MMVLILNLKKLDPLSRNLYEIFHKTTLPTLLRNYDRYSMANGVEVRMPFMDHRLVTYTFSLPWTSKVGGTYTKRIMRDALKEFYQNKFEHDEIKLDGTHQCMNGLRDLLKMRLKQRFLQIRYQKK